MKPSSFSASVTLTPNIPYALPIPIMTALSEFANGKTNAPQTALHAQVASLSQHYRAGATSAEAVRAASDASAYALSRMPACYGAVLRAFEALAQRLPEFAPHTVLDVGAGPGTASFAALANWPHVTLTLLEQNKHFQTMADVFLKRVAPATKTAIIKGDFLQTLTKQSAHDCVVMSYALNECAEVSLAALTKNLWAATDKVLILVEPGTPKAYQRLMLVRTQLIALGAKILAPCPHHNACPLPQDDWCHFDVRVPRSKAQIAAKAGSLPYEDEPFCYLIAAKEALVVKHATPVRARILRPPKLHKYGRSFSLCTQDGLREETVLKRDRARYSQVKKAGWGDGI